MRGLKGRRAVIAGGAGGIGVAICRRLGEEGMHVVVPTLAKGGDELLSKSWRETACRFRSSISMQVIPKAGTGWRQASPASMHLSPEPISREEVRSLFSQTRIGKRISGSRSTASSTVCAPV